MYKGCSESNAFYFVMLASNVRGGCQWYGSRGRTFPPVSLTCCCCMRDSSRGAVWHRSVDEAKYGTELLHVKKMVPTDINQHMLNVDGNQPVDVSTVRRWVVHFSSGNSNSGSPLLAQILTRVACKFLFTAGKKCTANGVTVLKKGVLSLSLCYIKECYCVLYLLWFPWKETEGITFRVNYI